MDKIEIKMGTDTAAFDADYGAKETARILRAMADKVETYGSCKAMNGAPIVDSNGCVVGKVAVGDGTDQIIKIDVRMGNGVLLLCGDSAGNNFKYKGVATAAQRYEVNGTIFEAKVEEVMGKEVARLFPIGEEIPEGCVGWMAHGEATLFGGVFHGQELRLMHRAETTAMYAALSA